MEQIDISKINAQISEMMAHTQKLSRESEKIANENKYYPMVVASGATLAIVAIVKLFL
jgi:predicted  nucleic acid-binding Zn ribbon protein